eukprot:13816576-Alexandrium_andersonii.AAC.1
MIAGLHILFGPGSICLRPVFRVCQLPPVGLDKLPRGAQESPGQTLRAPELIGLDPSRNPGVFRGAAVVP